MFDLLGDVIDIVSAPVKVAVDVTSAVTKPVAEFANDVVKEVRQIVK